jgi:hemerythrin
VYLSSENPQHNNQKVLNKEQWIMVWNENLSVGVAEIDEQHKALINAVNALFEACSEGKGRKKIYETMEFLQNYVGTHFGDEEKLQRQCGYPDYISHKKLHSDFVTDFLKYKNQLETEGTSIVLVGKFNIFVSEWLLYHISREDKKIGEYKKSRG